MTSPLPPLDFRQKVALARQLATMLDSAFEIPVIKKRVGLDPILGLIPGLGDVVSLAIALYIVFLARQIGMSQWQLSMMLVNIVMDTAFGAIPIIGDAFDVVWKSNIRNIEAMEKHLDKVERGALQPRIPRGSFQKTEYLSAGEQTIDVVVESPRTGTS